MGNIFLVEGSNDLDIIVSSMGNFFLVEGLNAMLHFTGHRCTQIQVAAYLPPYSSNNNHHHHHAAALHDKIFIITCFSNVQPYFFSSRDEMLMSKFNTQVFEKR